MQIDLTQVFVQLTVLFLLMACGYAAKKLTIIDDAFDRSLSRLVLNLSMPAMILSSALSRSELPERETVLICFGVACLGYALLIIVAELAVRCMLLPKTHRGVYRFACIFGNVGFIGFPVLSAVYGPDAVVYAAIFNIPFNVLVFTLGVLYLANDRVPGQEGDKRPVKLKPKMFVSPCTIACVIVMAFCLLGVHQVPILTPACSTLGAMTTPAALIVIGSNLATLPLRDLLGSMRLYITAAMRLVVAPLLTWFVFHFFVTDPVLLGALVIISGMPVASNGTLLSFQYGGDMKTMGQITFISTVLTFVTAPLLALFLATMG